MVDDKRPRRRMSPVDWLVLAAISLGLLLLSATCLHCYSRGRARRVQCAGNLKQIGLALMMYSGENSGYFPLTPPGNNFEPLNTDQVLSDGKVYGCPSALTFGTTASCSNYLYLGSGLRDDNPNATATVVAIDLHDNHPGGWVNALFVDGHVEGTPLSSPKPWLDQDMLTLTGIVRFPAPEPAPYHPSHLWIGFTVLMLSILAAWVLWKTKEEAPCQQD